MAVSKTHKGWQFDKHNGRLNFYYEGTRVGHITASGMDLASGLDYTIDGVSASGGVSDLDGAYDGGNEIAVDGSAVLLTGTQGTNDVLQITNASGGGACLDLAQSGTGKDIEGTSDTWTISKAGVIVCDSINTVGVVKFASDTLGTGATMVGYDGTDFIINALTGKSLDLQINDTNVVTVTGSAITLAQAVTISAGGLTVDTTGVTVSAGGITVTGNSIITGTLGVTGDIDWGGALTTDELKLDTDGTAPVGSHTKTELSYSSSNSKAYISVPSGDALHIQINANDEFTFNATALQVASANDIQFMGDDGILDSSGNEILLVEAVGSATTYLNLKNANGASIELECFGAADKGFLFKNDQNETEFEIATASTAVNWIKVLSQASGTPATIQSAGTADVGIDFENSEAEELLQLVAVASAVNNIAIVNAASGRPTIACNTVDVGIIFAEGSGTREEMLELIPVSTAVNHVTITSATSGNAPTIATGTADIGIIFAEGSGTAEEMLVLENIATAVDYINIKSGDGSTHPTISVAGDTSNADMILVAAGTGGFTLNSGTDPVTLGFLGAQDGYNNEIQDVNGNEIIALQGVTSAVGELTISNAVDAGNVVLGVQTSTTNVGLKLDTAGTGNIVLSLGGVDALGIHDSAVTLAAEAATDGHTFFMQTEDGGTASSSVGKAVAAWAMRTGDGSAGDSGTNDGGVGGAITVVCGAGKTCVITSNG